MEKASYTFPEVTLLITHYNRFQSLKRLLTVFREINCNFGDIVVSDDGSKPEQLEQVLALAKEFSFRAITTPKNRGLGNNINKGQDAVNTPLTLYIQEDFVPSADFGKHFQQAVDLMKSRSEIDVVRFYAYFKYPYLRNSVNGFSEMYFNIFLPGYKKFYYYSDHPHLRRSNFFQKFGRYIEGSSGDFTEYSMMLSFLQKKGKALFYEDFENLLAQQNSSDEPSTMKRNFWRESKNPAVFMLREAYRYTKFNYDLVFKKF